MMSDSFRVPCLTGASMDESLPNLTKRMYVAEDK